MKKSVKIIIVCLLVYLFSCVFNYWNIKTSYSKGGTRSKANVTALHMWGVYCPVMNTMISIYFIIDFPPWKTEEKDYKKHFNISK